MDRFLMSLGVICHGSSAGAFAGGFPQSLHVTHGRQTKKAFVLPSKVRSVAIADAGSCARDTKALAEHKPACLLQALLELQRARRRNGLEVVAEARDAHPELARDAVYPKRLVKVFMEALALTMVRPLLRRVDDLTCEWQLRRDEQVVCGVVQVALVAEKDLLAAPGQSRKKQGRTRCEPAPWARRSG
jgi:hypothetical protein